MILYVLHACECEVIFKCNCSLFTTKFAGSYELLPYYKGENTVFDVSPPSLLVSVEHSHMTIPQKFQVML